MLGCFSFCWIDHKAISAVNTFEERTCKVDLEFTVLFIFAAKRRNNENQPVMIPARGFPDSSVGKESACNAGDPSSIPGS